MDADDPQAPNESATARLQVMGGVRSIVSTCTTICFLLTAARRSDLVGSLGSEASGERPPTPSEPDSRRSQPYPPSLAGSTASLRHCFQPAVDSCRTSRFPDGVF
jgi:hypothetical protein